jgi:hypothetical protein
MGEQILTILDSWPGCSEEVLRLQAHRFLAWFVRIFRVDTSTGALGGVLRADV